MADVVNLNRFRKAKARAEDKAKAAENRVAFGRTKAEKTAAQAERARGGRTLDGAELSRAPAPAPDGDDDDERR